MKNKVGFYAPLGNLVKDFKIGGAEAGCRKTAEILETAGYQIVLIEKPAKNKSSILTNIVLFTKISGVFFKTFYILLTRKVFVYHIAGFYLKQVYFEWLLIKLCSLFRIKSIYEIRNGGMIQSYESSGKTYQWFMRSIFKNATIVLCQGEEYMPFVKQFNNNAVYYPNYVLDKFFINENPGKSLSLDIANLIYVGRVVPEKNIDFIIDICQKLNEAGLTFRLNIIGAYEMSYYSHLMDKIKAANLENVEINFLGRMNFDQIHLQLQKSHFFLFPSKERREGHSNALTEAMAFGVVPVASTAGFNQKVINCDKLVIKDFDAAAYAHTIIDIWQNNWLAFSNLMHNRVATHYTESIVKRSLLNAYNSLN